MTTLEQSLLEAADAFEKIAEEIDSDSKEACKSEDKSKSSESKDDKKDADSKDESKDDSKGQDSKDESKVKEIKEELGISDDLAEKVASADPSIVKLIKDMHHEIPVDSMGEVDSREKTASENEDPFGDFLSTPL